MILENKSRNGSWEETFLRKVGKACKAGTLNQKKSQVSTSAVVINCLNSIIVNEHLA